MAFLRKTFVFVLSLAIAVSALSLAACGLVATSKITTSADASVLHTDLQLEYINDNYNNVANYADGTAEKSKPNPATISWSKVNSATGYKVTVGEKADVSDGVEYIVSDANATSLQVKNLKVCTKYYYKVESVGSVAMTSDIGSFTTTDKLPRFIDCDGVTNMRDLGGYSAGSGLTVKQGLVYRCGRLNKSDTNEIKPNITKQGIADMRALGIKTEIDLRVVDYWDAANKMNEVGGLTDTSVIGADLNYYQCPIDVMAGVSNSVNYASVKKTFDHFADKNNYPIIFHCTIGTDRTGYIAYLLNGLLGVPKETLLRDYLFSNFGKIDSTRSISSIKGLYLDMLDGQPGDTLSKKIEYYLINTIGVSQNNINSIKGIMLDGHEYKSDVVTAASCTTAGEILHTCLDDASLTYTEYVARLPHGYEEVSGNLLRCKTCGKEKAKGDLPSEYTQVDYVTSSGTQYIDTGFKPNNNSRVIAEIDFETSSSSAYAFGYRDGAKTQKFAFSTAENSYIANYGTEEKYLGKYSGFDAFSYPDKAFTVDRNKTEFFINGVRLGKNSAQEFTCEGNMYIFALNDNGTAGKFATLKLYSMQIYDNGTLVRDFVPCYKGVDNEAGLYDLLNGKFYTNSGKGKLAYGIKGQDIEVEELLTALYSDTKAAIKDGVITAKAAGKSGAFIVDDAEVDVGADFMVTVKLDEISAENVGFVVGTLGSNNANHVMFDWRNQGSTKDIYIWRNDPYGWKGFDKTCTEETYPDLTCNIVHKSATLTFIYKNNNYYMFIDGTKVLEISEDQGFSWGASTIKSIVGTSGKIKLGVTTSFGTATFSGFTLTTDGAKITAYLADPTVDTPAPPEEMVVEVAAVPTGYTALNYIESTGTQYIDTGFAPDNNTRVVAVMDFPKTTDSSSHAAFSARKDGTSQEYGFLCCNNSYVSRFADDSYLSLDYTGKMTVDMDKNIFKVNNVVEKTHTATSFSCDYNMFIFACNQKGSVKSDSNAKLKLYAMKIYDNGTLVRDFAPCTRDSDEVAGLYDAVNGVFYVNNGTGTFNVG